jgi:hypothetical protein
LGSAAFHVGDCTLAATNAIANSDFENNVGATSYGSMAYASWSDSAYNDITLDAAGITNLNLTGVSEYSGQISWDILNDTTGLTWASSTESQFTASFADKAGTSNDPKLVVQYSFKGGANPMFYGTGGVAIG